MNKQTNKETKQTFLIKAIHSCGGDSNTSAKDSGIELVLNRYFFNLFRNRLLALQCQIPCDFNIYKHNSKHLTSSLYISKASKHLWAI